jgi:glycosyltransferase involved in cell wall biosynthesis
MRILIAGQTYYIKNNGQAVFTINLAEGLARTGYDVLVLAPSERARPYQKQLNGLTIQTVRTLTLPFNVNVSLPSARLVSRALAEFRPDIIHLQDHYFLSRSVLREAKRRDVLVMGTNHFLPDNLTYNLPIPGWVRKPFNRWLWKNMLNVYNTLSAITTPTETAARILRQQDIRVPVQAISCGVEQTRYYVRPEVDRRAMRQRHGLDPDKALFLYVGRVDREKELHVLMHALALLKRNDLQLAIVGRGSHLAPLKTLCRVLSLQQQVIFPGYVPEDDLPLLLNSADIFAMPSRAELQSIATLEAMSSGLPVLAANARALPELVEHGANGYLFPVGNVVEAARGIAALADQRSQWPKMGQISMAKASQHSLQNTIQRYATLYENIYTHYKMLPVQRSYSPVAGRPVRTQKKQVHYEKP